jgi:putative MFS transporter
VNTSIMNLVAIMGYSAVYTITPESYTTDVRNLGVGAANICARVSGVICPIFTGWLLTQSGGFEVAITIFAALFAVTALSALPLKETRPSAENKGLL